MRTAFRVGLLALIAAGCAHSPSFQAQHANPATADRQILLTVTQLDGSGALGFTGAPGKQYLYRRGYRASPAIERTLNQIAREHGLRRVEGWPIRSLGVYCEVFEVAEGVAVDGLIKRLSADPRVDLAQPMNIFETLTSRYDDPYAGMQTSVVDLDLEQAHYLATGRGVTVAVIDSAVDVAHPDLHGRIRASRDLVGSPKAPPRGELHGTAVAGVIAALANNGEGIIGVAPDVNIVALRACWTAGRAGGGAHCSSFTLARALEAAIQIGPQIINLSLAGPFDPLLSRLLDNAIQRGAVIVAARPEIETQALAFPASHQGVIVVQSAGVAASAGLPYRLTAPGNEILTTTPDSGYGFLFGNSLAAAHLSGVIALLMEKVPTIDADSIASLLATTSASSGRQTTINACRALQTLVDTPAACDSPITRLKASSRIVLAP